MFSRKLVLRLHILAALYNILYVYTPLHGWEYGFTTVQYISMPVLLISAWLMARRRKMILA